MSRVTQVIVLLLASFSYSTPLLAGHCLGPEAAAAIQAQFGQSFGEDGQLDSMTVLEDSLLLAVLVDGELYRFRATGGPDGDLAFAPLPPPAPPGSLQERLAQLAGQLPRTIWKPCGEERPEESRSGLQLLTTRDLGELPPGACRPVPGRVCADEYWTLPPRLSYAGAVVTYVVHVVIFLGILIAGLAWLRRRPWGRAGAIDPSQEGLG